MLFVATLTHPLEMCLAREEFYEQFAQWHNGMDDLAEKLEIKIHGAYVNPNEHTFWFVLETEDFGNIAAFFDGIMLTNHDGRVSPVISLSEAERIHNL